MSGMSSVKPLCKSTELNRCIATDRRWERKQVSRSSPERLPNQALLLLILLLLLLLLNYYTVLYCDVDMIRLMRRLEG